MQGHRNGPAIAQPSASTGGVDPRDGGGGRGAPSSCRPRPTPRICTGSWLRQALLEPSWDCQDLGFRLSPAWARVLGLGASQREEPGAKLGQGCQALHRPHRDSGVPLRHSPVPPPPLPAGRPCRKLVLG